MDKKPTTNGFNQEKWGMIWDDVGRCGCGRIGIILGLVVKISLVTGRLELLLYCYMSDRWPIESRPSWPSTMKPCNVGTLQEIHTYHISIIFYNIQYIYIYIYIYIYPVFRGKPSKSGSLLGKLDRNLPTNPFPQSHGALPLVCV